MDHSSQLTRFGLSAFRAGQREVIEAVMAGRDCLCIMPTGSGKSLCFQLPAIARPGLTLVISPLIALMKDQVDALAQRGIPATFINSSLESPERSRRTEGMVRGEYSLVYVAPERLRSATFLQAVRQSRISLLAIDEAHCISQWGHDFRPDYARLGSFRRRIGAPQTIALTATATDTVRRDIAEILELINPVTFVSGFARDNLAFRVESPSSNVDKDRRLLEYLANSPGSGIIYASTRKTCEHLVELLQTSQLRPAAFYHAGMEPADRKRIQDAFMSDEIALIVATNAFGMGIDKRALRFVVHYNMPGSMEAYYQEAGRAGRDGAPAECLLLYAPQDRFLQEFFIENSYPSRHIVRDVYRLLQTHPDDPIEWTLQEIKDELGASIGTEGIRVSETLLEKAGAIERLDSEENLASIRIDVPHANLPELLPREARAQRAVLRGLETLVGDLRGERVYFQPAPFAESLDMKWESVARALRELVKLKGIDYVPPFRGRAIHVLRREVPFEDLDIDFDELERRKANEYEKLNQIVGYVQSRRCRQLEILEYFGDPDRRICQRCDNCGGVATRPAPSSGGLSERGNRRVWIAIQVVLSGAARTHGRIGKQLLAQMLTGSSSKKLKPLRLDRLPTFGRLSQLRQETVMELIHQLLAGGWLVQTEPTRFRPVIHIGPSGQSLLSSDMDLDVVRRIAGNLAAEIATGFTRADDLEGEKQTGSAAAPPPGGAPPAILPPKPHSGSEHSRSHVSLGSPPAAADTREDSDTPSAIRVPPTVHSSPLSTTHSPVTSQSNMAAPARRTSTELQVEVTPTASADLHKTENPSVDVRPAYFWTWKLFEQGYDVTEVCQIRRLEIGQVVSELVEAAAQGLESKKSWLLTAAQTALLDSLAGRRESSSGAPIPVDLPPGVTLQQFIYYFHATD